MSNGIGPQNGIPAGQFGESSRAGNQSEIEHSALSYFLRLRSGSRELQEITPCLSRGRVVVSAAKSGHTTINENLLQNGQKSDDHLPPISTALVLYDPTLPHVSLKAHLENVADKAIKSSFEIAKFESRHLSLEEGRLSYLAQNLRGRAVVSAAQSGNVRVIERLLKNGSIREEDRGQAVINVAVYGHLIIFGRLLEGDAQINGYHRVQAVYIAARNGQVELIDMLLRNGPISVGARGQAVIYAAGNGHVELIDMLLQNGPISDEARGFAVEGAARNGHTEIIERLLRNDPISDTARMRAMWIASTCGHVEVIDMLLQNFRLSEEHRGEVVQIAAENGDTNIIDMLLQNGPISDKDRGVAVLYAARYGHVEVINMLLQDGAGIPRHFLDEAVFLLAEVGLDLPVLNALVDNALLANRYEDGINVHNGRRDDKTRAALELLWKHTKGLEIEKHFRSCLSYLEGLPESGKKTLALKALSGPREAIDNFPPLLDKESFSCNRFSLTGKELIGRLWGFISGCDEDNQHECKEGILTALSTSFEHGSLVCNQGKTQRLLIAVLQGRLEGVQIDDLAPVLSPDHALAVFFSDERRQNINDKEELLAEANSFLQLNPSVQRESFMAKLEGYWNLRDEAQGGAVQEEAVQEEAVQGGDDLE